MKFVGDIIITDPCYVMIKKEKDWNSYPNLMDFYSKKSIKTDKKGNEMPICPKAEDYDDAEDITLEDYLNSTKKYSKDGILLLSTMFLKQKDLFIDWYKNGYTEKVEKFFTKFYFLKKEKNILEKKSKKMSEEYNRYLIAMEKWEKENEDDFEKSKFGLNLNTLGFKNYLTSDTGYGDWSYTTFERETNKELGEFCADAGMVSVFLLEEILKYNPNFDYHIKKPWTTTWIKNFDGEIEIKRNNEDGVYVEGTGNINFYTIQTGI